MKGDEQAAHVTYRCGLNVLISEYSVAVHTYLSNLGTYPEGSRKLRGATNENVEDDYVIVVLRESDPHFASLDLESLNPEFTVRFRKTHDEPTCTFQVRICSERERLSTDFA